jgi:hypothetical protein
MNPLTNFKRWNHNRRLRDRERVEEILKQITYKPGYDWLLQTGKYFMITFHLPVKERDSLEETNISSVLVMDRFLPAHKILRQVFDHLKDMETHETGEFFKFRGQRYFDPHESKQNKMKFKELRRENPWWRINWAAVWMGFSLGGAATIPVTVVLQRSLGWSMGGWQWILLGQIFGALCVARWETR